MPPWDASQHYNNLTSALEGLRYWVDTISHSYNLLSVEVKPKSP